MDTVQPATQRVKLLDDISVDINITRTPYDIDPSMLFSVAARNNTKRHFLFVSKVIGKYTPISPKLGLMAGQVLSNIYANQQYGLNTQSIDLLLSNFKSILRGDLSKPTLPSVTKVSLPKPIIVIGFAETATGLGHAVHNNFLNKSTYIHTTRDDIIGMNPILNFEEEHSHATSHRVYALNKNILHNNHDVILVEDEITTGNTALNIIRSIQDISPRTNYTILTLLDFRTEEDIRKCNAYAEEVGINLNVISLLSGNVVCVGKGEVLEDTISPIPTDKARVVHTTLDGNIHINVSSADIGGCIHSQPYLYHTGRFGINSSDNIATQTRAYGIGKIIEGKIKSNHKVLCLGTGEFMFVPLLISSYIDRDVYFQSTARSPIHVNLDTTYPIKNKYIFPSMYDKDIPNFLYNIQPHQYDDIVLFIERDISEDKFSVLVDILAHLAKMTVHIVKFN